MAQAAAIEVLIRARDEASAAVAETMRRITGEAKAAEGAMANIGTRGSAAAGGVAALGTALGGAAGGGSALLGSLGGVVGMIGGPYGLAISAGIGMMSSWAASADEAAEEQAKLNRAALNFDAGPFVAQLEKANAEVDKLASRGTSFFGTMRQLIGEFAGGEKPEDARRKALEPVILRDQLAGEAADRQARAAREQLQVDRATHEAARLRREGDAEGANAAAAQAEAHAAKRLALTLEILNAERRIAETQYTSTGRPIPESVASAFQEKEKLAREQADTATQRRQEQAADAQKRLDEQRIQRESQATLKRVEGEKAIELALLDQKTKREIAEAERLGDIERAERAQIASINRVRDAEIKAIRESADARARAARGPTREEDVLAIRREEERAIRLQQIRAQTQAEGIEATAAKRPDLLQQTFDAIEKQRKEEGPVKSFLPEAYAPMMEQARLAAQIEREQINQEALRAGLAGRQGRLDVAEMRSRIVEESAEARDETASKYNPPEIGTGAAKLATDFDKATQSADALAGKVKELGGALKDLQTEPGFAAKLSQDLADTLQFIGARNP